ncbi:unnamed protein product [Fusarium graminearum]|uniref:Chromosome 1, complete genome n=1 Tax=Gibberella zeae (strain ATCC MYA-4620 / CBS 123657 / FGSC 9075 / NRRL 31084 / PH-1) TaxID=229533 RepID=A0A098D334_GIBZE|nr:unnamed protein product [Fusarium graminearum]CZS76624.1 unnamed protein product [Fusarium graminearum]
MRIDTYDSDMFTGPSDGTSQPRHQCLFSLTSLISTSVAQFSRFSGKQHHTFPT